MERNGGDLRRSERSLCDSYLRYAENLAVSPSEFAYTVLRAKEPLAERFGGFHRYLTVSVPNQVRAEDIRSAFGYQFLSDRGCGMLETSLYASEDIAVSELFQSRYAVHALGNVRKGARLIPAILKTVKRYYAADWEAENKRYQETWKEPYPYTKETHVSGGLRHFEHAAERLGQMHAVAGRSTDYTVLLTVAPSGWASLGQNGCDDDSCYNNGGAYEASKYALAVHPHSFVAFIYRGSAEPPEFGAATVLGRAWGMLGENTEAFYLNNTYSDGIENEDVHAIIRAAIEQVFSWTLIPCAADFSPLTSAYSEYTYVNGSARVWGTSLDAGHDLGRELRRVRGSEHLDMIGGRMRCSDCGDRVSEDDCISCENCGDMLCSDCYVSVAYYPGGRTRYTEYACYCSGCAGSTDHCADCGERFSTDDLTECTSCNDSHCERCGIGTCDNCEEPTCQSCLDNEGGFCSADCCAEAAPPEDEDEDETAVDAPSLPQDAPARCGCRVCQPPKPGTVIGHRTSPYGYREPITFGMACDCQTCTSTRAAHAAPAPAPVTDPAQLALAILAA